MKVRTIPAEVLNAYVAGLTPYIPDLTPTRFVAALQAFREEKPALPDRNAPPPSMLSLVESAKSLGVSRDTVKRMVLDGRLPGRKVGSQWRVPLAAVTALAAMVEEG